MQKESIKRPVIKFSTISMQWSFRNESDSFDKVRTCTEINQEHKIEYQNIQSKVKLVKA